MKKLTEKQIRERISKKRKIKFAFVIATFVAMVVNAFYFYELYKLGGEKTLLLKSIEVFNVLLSLGVYSLIVGYLWNNVTKVSRFLWYIDDYLLSNKSWKTGRRSVRFMEYLRMYSSYEELNKDVEELKVCNSKYSYWTTISAFALLPVLLCNSFEVLFCGESARIIMLWTKDVEFYLFFIPKCIFALLLVLSLFMLVHYKDKLRTLANDPTKSSVRGSDISDLI